MRIDLQGDDRIPMTEKIAHLGNGHTTREKQGREGVAKFVKGQPLDLRGDNSGIKHLRCRLSVKRLALDSRLMSDLTDTKLFMFIEYQSFRYMGLMAFDDPKSCHAIYTLLKSNIGRSIKEIGDLDVSYTL